MIDGPSSGDDVVVQPVPPPERRILRFLQPRDAGGEAKRRRRRKPVLVFFAILLLFGAAGGVLTLLNSPMLDISTIEIEGADVVSAATVRQLVGLKGKSVLQVDLEAAQRRVAALPMVKDVEVSRDWPNGIKVVIMEREPWGRWRANNTVWAIDAEGVVLETPAAPDHGPIVTQVSALPAIKAGARVDLTAIALAAELEARGAPLPLPRISAFEWSLSDGFVVVTEHGRIIFGDINGLDYKYELWELLEREALRRDEPLLFADLRFGLRPRVEIGLNLGRGIRPEDRSTADFGQSSTAVD